MPGPVSLTDTRYRPSCCSILRVIPPLIVLLGGEELPPVHDGHHEVE
jgi:hypothetical protein